LIACSLEHHQTILWAALQDGTALSESDGRKYTALCGSVLHDVIDGDDRMPGNRNILFLIIGALVVAVSVLGYSLYQTKKEPEGLQINVGPNGLKIQNK
jgi:hypothetical protein